MSFLTIPNLLLDTHNVSKLFVSDKVVARICLGTPSAFEKAESNGSVMRDHILHQVELLYSSDWTSMSEKLAKVYPVTKIGKSRTTILL